LASLADGFQAASAGWHGWWVPGLPLSPDSFIHSLHFHCRRRT
jgi:hypothetical protein